MVAIVRVGFDRGCDAFDLGPYRTSSDHDNMMHRIIRIAWFSIIIAHGYGMPSAAVSRRPEVVRDRGRLDEGRGSQGLGAWYETTREGPDSDRPLKSPKF